MDSNAGIILEYSSIYRVDVSVASAGTVTGTWLMLFLPKVWLLVNYNPKCLRIFMLLIKRK